MYKIIVIISILVRQFVLPNPFECFGNSAFIINLIAEPIIHAVAYGLVGLVYHRGDEPAFGSLLYLVAYAALVGILWVLGQFAFAWWAIVGMIVLVVAVVILLRKIGGEIY